MSTAQAPPRPSDTDSSEALRRLELYMEIYRHHFDLFLKGTLVYFAMNGVIAGYLVTGAAPREIKTLLALILIAASATGFAGCVMALRWVKQLKRAVRDLEQNAAMPEFPFWGARAVVQGTLVAVLVLGCSAAAVLWTL